MGKIISLGVKKKNHPQTLMIFKSPKTSVFLQQLLTPKMGKVRNESLKDKNMKQA